MVSPQKENGFTPIANELLEAFYKCKLTEYERCVVMCLWRKTYGWSKKEDWVSNTQIEEETGIALPNITRTLKLLKKKKVVCKEGNKSRVNKAYIEWEVKWRILPEKLSHQITKVISPDNQKLSHQIPTKERKKLTKEITEQSSEIIIKDMSFKNQRKYKEDGHWDEPAIDADTGENIPDAIDTEKVAERELNEKIRHNLHLVEDVRGLPFGKGKDMAYHVKIYRSLLETGWSHESLITGFIELINSDYWKEKRQVGQYPGMNTLQSLLRNKKPV